jgi:antirestriction protein ArdC
MSMNPVTNRVFTRGNEEKLAVAGEEAGWQSGQWATYKQWISIGRVVRKGQTGTRCLLPKVEKTSEGTEIATSKIVKGFTVFAFEQTDELPSAVLVERQVQ